MKSERVVTSDPLLCVCYYLIFYVEWNFQTGHVNHTMTLFKEETFSVEKEAFGLFSKISCFKIGLGIFEWFSRILCF